MTLTPNGPLKASLRVEDRGASLAVSVSEASGSGELNGGWLDPGQRHFTGPWIRTRPSFFIGIDRLHTEHRADLKRPVRRLPFEED